MGSTAVYPEVIRTEVTELLGVGVHAVDAAPEDSQTTGACSAPVRAAGAEALPAAEPTALDVDATYQTFPLAPMQHELWLGRHNKQQVGGVGNCPDWVTDEPWVGGRGKARGYRGGPNPIADRFVEHGGRVWHAVCANPAVLSGIQGVG